MEETLSEMIIKRYFGGCKSQSAIDLINLNE